MSKIYVYSTLSNDQRYRIDGDREVFIRGRANVSDGGLETPRGKVTAITEDEFFLLQKNKVFAAHSKNGFLSSSHQNEDPESFAKKNLEPADKSAQDTPATAAKRNPKAAKASEV